MAYTPDLTPTGAPPSAGADKTTELWPDQSTPVDPFPKQNTYGLIGGDMGPPSMTGLGTPRVVFKDIGTQPGQRPGNYYIDGDQWAPRNQPSAQIQQLQLRMVASGLLDEHKVHFGIWDVESAQAYALVLAQANTYGASGADMLDALQQHADTIKEKEKQQRQYTNPEDLRTGLANAAPNLVGGELPKGEQDAYLQYYKAQEVNAYDQQAAGNPYTAPMGAEAYIRQQHPEQVDAYNSASRLIEFYRMLGVVG